MNKKVFSSICRMFFFVFGGGLMISGMITNIEILIAIGITILIIDGYAYTNEGEASLIAYMYDKTTRFGRFLIRITKHMILNREQSRENLTPLKKFKKRHK